MIIFDLNSLLTLFLLHVRILSFLLVVPFFGRELLPNTFKVFLATALSLTLFMYADIKPLDFPTIGHFYFSVLKEFLFGFFSGLFLRFIFDAVMIAGEVISVNMGIAIATLFLPQQPQTSVMSVFFMLFFTSLFLAIGGPEMVFLALVSSLKKVPLGGFDLYSVNLETFLSLFYESFNLGVWLSLPIVLSMLLLNLVLAVVNRFIPQVNVFIVGLPLQIFLGFLLLVVLFPLLSYLLSSHLKEYMIEFIKVAGG
ncbi:flagellar biosynthetic protein FliR [Thermocrinis sp.]|uniref:flagellar biosynthetic protein FliR n=1 Tax=Thermocrinis sp. TaxID=2024383 RepID=UPI002FDE494C